MTTAVYLRGVDGRQSLSTFDTYRSSEDIRDELESVVEQNNLVVDDFLVATTRGQWFYDDVVAVAEDVVAWSRG